MTLQLARHHLGLESSTRDELGFFGDPAPIPLFVRCDALAASLRKRGLLERNEIDPAIWPDLLAEHLQARRVAVERERALQLLEAGRLIVLLDGLDEVSGARDRERVAGAAALLAQHYRGPEAHPNRLVVTCRTRACGEGRRFAHFEPARLLDLDEPAIERFVRLILDLGKDTAERSETAGAPQSTRSLPLASSNPRSSRPRASPASGSHDGSFCEPARSVSQGILRRR